MEPDRRNTDELLRILSTSREEICKEFAKQATPKYLKMYPDDDEGSQRLFDAQILALQVMKQSATPARNIIRQLHNSINDELSECARASQALSDKEHEKMRLESNLREARKRLGTATTTFSSASQLGQAPKRRKISALLSESATSIPIPSSKAHHHNIDLHALQQIRQQQAHGIPTAADGISLAHKNNNSNSSGTSTTI